MAEAGRIFLEEMRNEMREKQVGVFLQESKLRDKSEMMVASSD